MFYENLVLLTELHQKIFKIWREEEPNNSRMKLDSKMTLRERYNFTFFSLNRRSVHKLKLGPLIFIFHQLIIMCLRLLWKLKCFLLHLKSSLVLELRKFLYLRLHLYFFLVGHCFRVWSNVYESFESLWHHQLIKYELDNILFGILRRKKGMTFKLCQLTKSNKITQNSDGLVNNPKQPLKNKIFWDKINKNYLKMFYFFFRT